MPQLEEISIPRQSISFDRRSDLPKKSGIYFVVDRQRKVRYIGLAEDLQRRWQNHHKASLIERLDYPCIHYRQFPKFRLRFEEARAIAWFHPDLNGQFPSPNKHKTLLICLDDFLSGFIFWGAISCAVLLIAFFCR